MKTLVFILSFLLACNVFGSSKIPSYEKIFNLKYNEVKHDLAHCNLLEEKAYYEALNDFVYFISTGDTSISNSFLDNIDHRIHGLAELSEYEKLLYESEMHFMCSMVYFITGSYLKSPFPIYKSYRKFKKARQLEPENKMHLKLSGIYHLVSSSVPEEYNWILKMAGVAGDIQTGLNQIQEYQEYEKIRFQSTLQSSILLSMVFSNFINDYDAAIKVIEEEENENQILVFLQARAYSKLGKNEKSIHILENYIHEKDSIQLSYLYYQLGSALLYKLDSASSFYLFNYLEKSKYPLFKRSVCLKLAWYYTIFNDPDGLENCKHMFYAYEEGFNDADKQATLEMNYLPYYNVHLLRSRLLFDGGYYKASLKSLKLIDPEGLSNVATKVEYMYRLARIYHKTGQTNRAIQSYEQVIRFGDKIPFYFAANSALQLGLIYEEKNAIETAEEYYRQCLKINTTQYQNSIEHQAKAGLNRIRG